MRYKLTKLSNTRYQARDEYTGVALEFDTGTFLEGNQQVIVDDDVAASPRLATAAREIADWLAAEHPDIVYPVVQYNRILIGKRITQLRRAADLSQGDLADQAGLHQSHIARIEAGKYNVSVDTLAKIAQVLGCRVDLTPIMVKS